MGVKLVSGPPENKQAESDGDGDGLGESRSSALRAAVIMISLGTKHYGRAVDTVLETGSLKLEA